jgi:hypothetical protein
VPADPTTTQPPPSHHPATTPAAPGQTRPQTEDADR